MMKVLRTETEVPPPSRSREVGEGGAKRRMGCGQQETVEDSFGNGRAIRAPETGMLR